MRNLQQLALLVSLRIHHHRDSHMPLQLLHHNLLLLDLPHHPHLTTAESRITFCSKRGMMFLHNGTYIQAYTCIHLYSTLYSFDVFLLPVATRKHVQFSLELFVCVKRDSPPSLSFILVNWIMYLLLICCKIVRSFCAFRES